jgi:hypothetical protein
MRKALNENTTVQIAVIAVLMLGAGLLLMTQMKGGSEPAEPVQSAAAGGTTAAGVDPASAVSAVQPVTAAPTAQPAASVGPLESSPGLPADVLADYKGGKTIVLLIVHPGGIDDRMVKDAVESLRSDPDLAVYVTGAKGIARYSRITQGVGVSRVPALVVVSPRGVGSSPTATVDYGFRSSESVVQAVRDAAYKGRDIGYDPG